jgi:hypothetical protein
MPMTPAGHWIRNFVGGAGFAGNAWIEADCSEATKPWGIK